MELDQASETSTNSKLDSALTLAPSETYVKSGELLPQQCVTPKCGPSRGRYPVAVELTIAAGGWLEWVRSKYFELTRPCRDRCPVLRKLQEVAEDDVEIVEEFARAVDAVVEGSNSGLRVSVRVPASFVERLERAIGSKRFVSGESARVFVRNAEQKCENFLNERIRGRLSRWAGKKPTNRNRERYAKKRIIVARLLQSVFNHSLFSSVEDEIHGQRFPWLRRNRTSIIMAVRQVIDGCESLLHECAESMRAEPTIEMLRSCGTWIELRNAICDALRIDEHESEELLLPAAAQAWQAGQEAKAASCTNLRVLRRVFTFRDAILDALYRRGLTTWPGIASI